MLTTIAAAAMACVFAHGVVSFALWLVGKSPVGRIAVYAAAFLTGAILPWAIVDGMVGLVSSHVEA